MADDDKVQRDPVFYYSREHRLKNASKTVKEMNEGSPAKQSFVESFLGNKTNLMLFITIILICACFVILPRLLGNEIKLGGNNLALILRSEEGHWILDLTKKAPKNGVFYTGAVEISVAPAKPREKAVPPAFIHRVSFKPLESETFRFSLPFDGTDFFVTLKAGEEQISVRVRGR